MDESFEAGLTARVDAMLDACTRCGKCVEACPITDPAGVADAPRDVITGVIDILRGADGTAAARAWAGACVASGECIKACDYGVNPRFLLAMARVAIARARMRSRHAGARGSRASARVARDVNHLSRLQLEDELLERLGQRAGADTAEPQAKPDFVFYTGCNVLKTPHIALLALDVMDALGVTYRVLGGPTHCCGVHAVARRRYRNARPGRAERRSTSSRQQYRPGAGVVPELPVQFTEVTLPTIERMRGARPFEMTPFMRFLRRNSTS